MPSRKTPRVRPGPWGAVAASLAALPAIAGPIMYGSTRWWIAGLLAFSSFSALACWAATRPRDLGPWRAPAGFLALALWCAWLGVLGLLHAPVPHASLIGWLHAASCLASGLVLADVVARSAKGWNLLACLLCATLVFEAGYAIVQHFQESPFVLFARKAPGYALRESGTYLCPNHFANLLALGMCAALGFMTSRRAGFTARLFSGLVLVMSVPALFYSQSRTAIASGLIGVWITLVVLAATKSWRRAAVAFFGLPMLLSFGVVIAAKVDDQLSERFSREIIRRDLRFHWWRDIPDMMRDSPPLGWGVGTFPDVAAGYRHHFVDVMSTLNHAHNEALHIAVEQGLPGSIVAGICLLLGTISGARLLRRAKEDENLPAMAGWIGCMVTAGLHAMFDFNLRIFANNHLLVMISALAAAGAAPARRQAGSPGVPDTRWRWWPAGLATMALAGMGLSALTWIGSLYQLRAQVSLGTLVQDLPAAHQALMKGRGIDRLNAFFPLQLGLLYADQAWHLQDPAEKTRATDEAVRWLDRAEALNPNAFELFQGRVEVLLLRGDPAGALAAARQMTQRFSAVVACHIQVGDILADMGRIGEAADAYWRAWERSGGTVGQALRLHQEMVRKEKAGPAAPSP